MVNKSFKSEKGVTLLALTIYMIVLTAVLGMMTVLSNLFYNNVYTLQDTVENAGDFDTLNSSLIIDAKANTSVRVDESTKTIVFGDDTTYKYNEEEKTLKRSNKDNICDISILGTVTPFNMFKPNEKEVINTVEKMNMTLRTYTGGYIRFENDNYMGGNNPWPVATLWMAQYNLKIGKAKEAMEKISVLLLKMEFIHLRLNKCD